MLETCIILISIQDLQYLCKHVAFSFSDTESKYNKDKMPYCWKLEKIREFLRSDQGPTIEEVNEHLGTDISALGSVPAAVYSFLRSPNPVEGLQVIHSLNLKN